MSSFLNRTLGAAISHKQTNVSILLNILTARTVDYSKISCSPHIILVILQSIQSLYFGSMVLKKQYILTFLLTIWVVFSTQEYVYASTPESLVYYCTGPKSKKFHKYNNCKGLKHCSGEIRKCSKKEALKKGFTSCKYCYKND